MEAIAFVSYDACFCLSKLSSVQGSPFLLSLQESGEKEHSFNLFSSCHCLRALGSLVLDYCDVFDQKAYRKDGHSLTHAHGQFVDIPNSADALVPWFDNSDPDLNRMVSHAYAE